MKKPKKISSKANNNVLSAAQFKDLCEKIEEKIWESIDGWKERMEEHMNPSPETKKRLNSLENKNETKEDRFVGWKAFGAIIGVTGSVLGVSFFLIFWILQTTYSEVRTVADNQSEMDVRIQQILGWVIPPDLRYSVPEVEKKNSKLSSSVEIPTLAGR